LGNRDRYCPRCGTRQPREPKSHACVAIAGIVLNTCAASAVAADADIAQRMTAHGSEVQSSTPEGLARFMREESARSRKVIASAGIKSE
jgi:hypothetical protein